MSKKDEFKNIVSREVIDSIIPKNITKIRPYAFYTCANLKTLRSSGIIPVIEQNAFKSTYDGGLNNLKTIDISVNTINTGAIGCRNIESITLNNLKTLKNRAIAADTLLANPTTWTLKQLTINGENAILEDSAFSVDSAYAPKLDDIVINGVTSIGKSVFGGWSATNITMSDVQVIGETAFSGCTFSNSFEIPESVHTIGSKAFNGTKAPKFVFNQPNGMNISLPTAGSDTGMFYTKNATELTIYTDNETIKNYDWATDNITATIYHLDGSAWA